MSRGFLIGIDLGGTNCRLALISDDGRILVRERFSSRDFNQADALLERLGVICENFRSLAHAQGRGIDAIGAGVPGLVDNTGRILVAPNLPWLNNCPFADWLGAICASPVAVVNDANAIAWGEHAWGGARPFRSFLAVTLGTGVGGGLVLGERLWSGADGAAGEFGHVVVEPEGHPCGCGSRGCLEQYSSATGILRSVRAELERGRHSSLASLEAGKISAEEVGLAARRGDELAMDVLNEAGRRLGQALAMMANVLNLEGVVICGGVSSSLDLFRSDLERELSRRAFAVAVKRMQIVAGRLGDDAGILGAAHFASCEGALW